MVSKNVSKRRGGGSKDAGDCGMAPGVTGITLHRGENSVATVCWRRAVPRPGVPPPEAVLVAACCRGTVEEGIIARSPPEAVRVAARSRGTV